MKKLLLIALASLSLSIGASFAADMSASISPSIQQGVSGSTVQFTLNVVNTTGLMCGVDQIVLYHDGISTITSGIPQILNQIPGRTIWRSLWPTPYLFQVNAGQTSSIPMSGTIIVPTWDTLYITGSLQYVCSGSNNGITIPLTGMQILPTADLQVTKSILGSLPYFSGDLVTYVITVKNIGSTGAENVVVQDSWPLAALNFVSATPGYNNTLPLFSFTIGTLLPGQQQNITMVGSLKPGVLPDTVFSNNVTVTTTSLQYNTGNDSAVATGKVLTADLNLFSGYLVGAQPQQSGDTVHFSLWYFNSGPAMSGQRTISVSGTATSGQVTPSYFLGNSTGNMGVSVVVNARYAPGTPICLHATLSGTIENGPLTNNTFTICTSMAPLADLYITKTMLPFTGFTAGSVVTYILNYGNAGGATMSGVVISDTLPGVISATPTMRTVGALQPGQTGSIILTGTLTTTLTGGTTFVNRATIGGNGIEYITGNNITSITGTIVSLPNVMVDIKAHNVTKPQLDTAPYGSGMDSRIQAVSGDVVVLTILYGNNGNMAANNGILTLAGLNGLLSYNSYTGAIGHIGIGQTGVIIITGIVGPQNYVSFTPTATLTYNSTQTVSDSVTIQEPLVCGDGLLTRTEVCDTNGQIGLLRSGQVCENQAGVCTVVTKNIINTACIDYRFTLGSGHICDQEQLPIVEPVGSCKSLDVHGSTVVLADENNGRYQGDADFTCSAQTGIAKLITIDCGNGTTHTGTNTASLNATCHFDEAGIPTNRTVQCYVDGTTQNACQQKMIIDQATMAICGDGHLDPLEDCDLGSTNNQTIGDYLDADENVDADEYANDGYTCHNCDIRKNEKPVGNMAACFSLGNNNISVQENEMLPFWRAIDGQKNLTNSCSSDNAKGKVLKSTLMCEFRLFNGAHQESESVDESHALTVDGEKTITIPCAQDMRDGAKLFDYFTNQEDTNRTLKNAFGKYYITMKGNILSNGGDEDKVYGEYNIALYRVYYDYCDQNGDEQEGTPIDRVCETDFTVTKPYLAQKSSFGLIPKATTVNLDGYKDIFGTDIIKTTDLDKIMVLDAKTYDGGTDVNTLMKNFVNKYEKLAIKVQTINDGAVTVSKVPSQNIFVFKGKGTITLNNSNRDNFTAPFTMIIDGVNLVIKGSLTNTNGMFLVKGGKILFEDGQDTAGGDRCPATQTVQGIFVTDTGFGSNKDENLSNTDTSQLRCSHGGLYVKGVLIGDGIDELINDRRSQLNNWFYSASADLAYQQAKRRNDIFNGAAVLIEYSPSLRSSLPPGASDFTKALDVYKK